MYLFNYFQFRQHLTYGLGKVRTTKQQWNLYLVFTLCAFYLGSCTWHLGRGSHRAGLFLTVAGT